MSTELEERLRGAMQRFTGGVRVPPGLAVKAHRHQQKRRARIRAAAATGTVTGVAATAVAIAGVTGAFGSAGPTPAQATYTAYVVSHVEHALAGPGQHNLVAHVRDVYQPGMILKPVGPFVVLPARQPGASSPWSVGSTQMWMYRGQARMEAYSPAGQRVYELGAKFPLGRPGRSIAVDDSTRTWWQEALAVHAKVSGKSPINCGPRIQIPAGAGWAAFIQHQLSCGEYRVTGRQTLDGVNAIKIVSKQSTLTLWVNPGTYLPVRLVQDMGGVPGQSDFSWLAATPAHLAHLRVTVPAGYEQVPPPSWWAKG
jgi:hypothetical protein